MVPVRRSTIQKTIDFITFPIRALTLFDKNKWGLSSLASERFDYVAAEVIGYCLDVGCGKRNRFIKEYLVGNGMGIDVFPYEGLNKENLVKDISHFPFPDSSFNSLTFIANINHIPEGKRDIELREAFRVLKPYGNIIVTMGNPVSEVLTHKIAWFYDILFKTKCNMDKERGMSEEEDYFLRDSEIIERLTRAGFKHIEKKWFLTQWALNHLFLGWKEQV